jgi:hypothetical protein
MINNIDNSELVEIISSLNAENTFNETLKKYSVLNTYFVGATFCIDLEVDKKVKVITVCYNDETFGDFEGGNRYLLSLKALRELKILMDSNGIKYTNKLLN